MNEIIQGDCVEVMSKMEKNSIDTIITDPPYGLSFMGKKWDYNVPSQETFAEMLRVTKPGGTMLCFAGTRTQHRMAVNIEDAGWILKDCIMWLYGSGFPKATDISKQLDKNNGREFKDRYKIGEYLKESRQKNNITIQQVNKWLIAVTKCQHYESSSPDFVRIPTLKDWNILKIKLDLDDRFDNLISRIEAEREVIGKKTGTKQNTGKYGEFKNKILDVTLSKTPEAKLWEGWKSHGLKPAYEPIIVAMKPNEGTYAQNALKYGVAGLNIDGGRIGTTDKLQVLHNETNEKDLMGNMKGKNAKGRKIEFVDSGKGRFPANIILDEEAARLLDLQKGGASRFFYVAKASKAERNLGLEGFEEKTMYEKEGRSIKNSATYYDPRNGKTYKSIATVSKNHHPTVKPIKLMEYLCRLTETPTKGIVLDPFVGSGTTCIAAKNMGRDYIGIEKDPEYVKIAEARLKAVPDKLL